MKGRARQEPQNTTTNKHEPQTKKPTCSAPKFNRSRPTRTYDVPLSQCEKKMNEKSVTRKKRMRNAKMQQHTKMRRNNCIRRRKR